MRRLILVRHAKTERRAESGDDFDRALTDEGRRAAAALGEALAGAGLIPEVALVSAARRTRETFALMAPNLPDVHEDVTRRLYEAPPEAMRALAEASPAGDVMLVGHNPGVQALALALAGECMAIAVEDRQALENGFPTGSAAAFEFDGARTGCLGVFRPGTAG